MRVIGGARDQWVAAGGRPWGEAGTREQCVFLRWRVLPSPSLLLPPRLFFFFFFFSSSERNLKGGLCNVPFPIPGCIWRFGIL